MKDSGETWPADVYKPENFVFFVLQILTTMIFF